MHIASETIGWSFEVKTFKTDRLIIWGYWAVEIILTYYTEQFWMYWLTLTATEQSTTVISPLASLFSESLISVKCKWSWKQDPVWEGFPAGAHEDLWWRLTSKNWESPAKIHSMLSENQYLNTPRWKAVPVLICITPWWCDELFISGRVAHLCKVIFMPFSWAPCSWTY